MQIHSGLDLVVTALEKICQTSDRIPHASRAALSEILEARAMPPSDKEEKLEAIRQRVTGACTAPTSRHPEDKLSSVSATRTPT